MYKKIVLLYIVFALSGCNGPEKSDRVYLLFNEGVALSLEAVKEFENGNNVASDTLNKKAISKFKEILKIDSSHVPALGALGHSYYLIRDFNSGISSYEKAIKLDTTIAANYREYGLCKINVGAMTEGRVALDKAFQLDNSDEIKEMTILDLVDIGTLAFDYGNGYEKQGEKQKGLDYKGFAIEVLITAYQIDTTNMEVVNKIYEFSEKVGNKEVSDFFKEKMTGK